MEVKGTPFVLADVVIDPWVNLLVDIVDWNMFSLGDGETKGNRDNFSCDFMFFFSSKGMGSYGSIPLLLVFVGNACGLFAQGGRFLWSYPLCLSDLRCCYLPYCFTEIGSFGTISHVFSLALGKCGDLSCW